MMVHLVPYKPLEAFKAKLAPKGMVIDMMSTFKTIVWNWYNKFTFEKAQVCAICDTNQCRKFTIGDGFNGGKEAKVIVDSTYPLEKSINAWACNIIGHATCKVVVTCNN
jgi:hypothetical protein